MIPRDSRTCRLAPVLLSDAAVLGGFGLAHAQQSMPNILPIVSDDTGPITLSQYQRFQWIRDSLEKEGVTIPLPTGN